MTPLVRITLGRIGSTTLGRITLGRINQNDITTIFNKTDGGGGGKGGLNPVHPDYAYVTTARNQDEQIIEIIIALNMSNLI